MESNLNREFSQFQLQLYGSTTVVMATHGSHWKWLSLTTCQRHPGKPIEKIFGMIDYVIDLKNLAKFGFEKIFPDGGTHTQHERVRPFFSLKKLFYALWWGCSQNDSTDFDAQYVNRRRLVRVRPFSRNYKNRSMTLTLKRSKSAICLTLKILTRIFSKTVRDREKMLIEVEWWKYFWPRVTSKGQRSRSNPAIFEVEYFENGTR